MGDLWSENVCDVALENGWRVSPAHGEYCKTEGAEGGVKGSHIAGVLVELTLVKGDVEIEGSVDRSSGEVFGDNVGVWRHSGVANCDCIERL